LDKRLMTILHPIKQEKTHNLGHSQTIVM